MLFSLVLGLLASCIVTSAFHMSGLPEKTKLDKIFNNYAETNHFREAQMGVMRGTQLIYAEGRGDVTSRDTFPVQDLSKAFTAVAILQLAEQGLLSLEMAVFGESGLLAHLTPLDNMLMDSRLYDVTVEHLLRHTAGWDEREGPLFDPMMNQVLVALGKAVPDIATESHKAAGDELTHDDVIQYVMTQTLQYTPGEHVVESNFGYCLLGRIIEYVTDKSYEDYVKENVLKPSGMWHTRLGRRDARLRILGRRDARLRIFNDKLDESERRQYEEAYKTVSFKLLDSTLGWYSNVYDIARFFTALSNSGPAQLLHPETLDYALARHEKFALHHTESWPALGLTAQKDGTLILESSDSILGLSVFVYKQPASEASSDTEARDNTMVIFIGYSTTHKKHLSPLQDAILSLNLAQVTHNAYIEDLSDKEITTDNTRVLLKTKLNEHRVEAYTNAMRLAGYYVRWLHGYSYNGHTNFIALFQLATTHEQLQYKLIKSASKVKLYKFISANSKFGYHVDAMQSFRSASHEGHTVHYVLMKQLQHPTPIMFNLGSLFSTYEIELQHLQREGYQVASQSIEYDSGEKAVTYILQKDIHSAEQAISRAYDDVSIAELSIINKLQNKDNFYIIHIDTYTDYLQQKFSVVFQERKAETTNMTFETEIELNQFAERAELMSSRGFLPTAAASYESNGTQFVAVQWVGQN